MGAAHSGSAPPAGPAGASSRDRTGAPADHRTRARPSSSAYLQLQPAPPSQLEAAEPVDLDELAAWEVQQDEARLRLPDVTHAARQLALSASDSHQSLLHPAMESSTPAWAAGLEEEAATPCASELELQFVYGLGSGRRNVLLLPSGGVVFFVGRLVVLYDPRLHQQRFLRGHSAQVRCIALHPSGAILASGQAREAELEGRAPLPAPEVCVWQADTHEPLAVLSGSHSSGVAALAFSADGSSLLTVGADAAHAVALWDWRRRLCLATLDAGAAPIFDVCPSPSEEAFATAGVGEVVVWRAAAQHSLAASRVSLGVLGEREHPTFTCVAYLPWGVLVGGCSRGEVWCWAAEGVLLGRYRAHRGAIFALGVEPMEGHLLSGGSDGHIRLWAPGFWPSARRRTRHPSAPPDPSSLQSLDLSAIATTAHSRGGVQLSRAPCVRAIHVARGKALVSTRSAEVLLLEYRGAQLESVELTLLLQGPPSAVPPPPAAAPPHEARAGRAYLSAAAFAVHPTAPILASAAADRTLRLWQLQAARAPPPRRPSPHAALLSNAVRTHQERVQVASRTLPGEALALAFSPVGDTLAVGLQGGVLLLQVGSLQQLNMFTLEDERASAVSLAYAPYGAVLAVGTSGGAIELHSTAHLMRVGVCRAHTAAVVSLDWSEGGGELMSNAVGYELLFWDAQTFTPLPPESTRELRWASASCRVAWGLKGVVAKLTHPDLLTASARTAAGTVLACGGLDGAVSLWHYPCHSASAAARTYDGHAAAVGGVCWAAGDGALLSISLPTEGGDGGEILQWRHVGDERPAAAAAAEEEEAEVDSDVEAELRGGGGGAAAAAAAAALEPELYGPRLQLSRAPLADGGAALDATLSALEPPSAWAEAPPLDAAAPPDDLLRLEWAYGARSHGAHSHVHWTAGGEVVFPAASLGVVLEPRGRTQRFFTAHTDEVLCVAPHPNGVLVGSGQAGAAPFACVWDSRTAESLAALRGAHAGGVCALAFDGSGRHLATCGLEPTHCVAVWEWARGVLLARVSTGAMRLFGVAFFPDAAGAPLPAAAPAAPPPLELAACGVRSISFLRCPREGGGGARCSPGAWRGAAAPCALLCVACAADECYTGTSRGEILVWADRALLRAVRAHAGPVLSLALAPRAVAAAAGAALLLLSVGKGGKLRRWAEQLRPLETTDLRAPLAAAADEAGGALHGLVLRSVCADSAGRLLLATGGGELFVAPRGGGRVQLLLQGHAPCKGAAYPGGVRALATHPTRPLAVSAAADATLRLWDLRRHAMLACAPLPSAACALDLSADGGALAVAMDDGGWRLLDAHTLRPPRQMACEPLGRGGGRAVKFSPGGEMLALAAARGVQLYAPSASGWGGGWGPLLYVECGGAPIAQLDWSAEPVEALREGSAAAAGGEAEESWLLRACTAAAELLHLEVRCERAEGRVAAASLEAMATPASVKDVSWASDTCSVCWGTLALHTAADVVVGAHEMARGSPLLPVDRSHEGEVLAAADPRGGVSLWRWPAALSSASCTRARGHARPPAAVRFSHDDSVLLTAGGADGALLQWRHLAEVGSDDILGEDDSDVEPDLKEVADFTRPKSRGLSLPESRRAFVEASSIAQAARASGTALAALEPQHPVPLPALSAAGTLLALDDIVSERSFESLRPWLRRLGPPSHEARAPSEAPPLERLVAEWVHGVRTFDCRSNVHVSTLGELVYHTGATVVVAPLDGAPRQRLYREHTAEITCLALHSDGHLCASGQLGAQPPIRVWDPSSMRTQALLQGAHTTGVAAIAFSADGQLLASADLSQTPLVCLWDWHRSQLLLSARAGRQRVLGLLFNPLSGVLVSFGPRQLRFWAYDKGQLRSRRARFGPGGRHCILCAAFLPDGETLLCGTAGGHLVEFTHGRCESTVQINRQQPIFAIYSGPEGVIVSGKGGRVLWWPGKRVAPLQLGEARVVNLSKRALASSELDGHSINLGGREAVCVRALTARGDRLVLATRSGQLWEMMMPWAPSTVSDEVGSLRLLVQGHSASVEQRAWQGEATALATHPRSPNLYATGADDGTVRLWGIAEKAMLGMRLMPGPVTALAFSSDGMHLACGGSAGSVSILAVDTLAEVLSFTLDARYAVPTPRIAAASAVGALAYSPDDALLAVAGPGGALQILEVSEHYRLLHSLQAHTTPILHIDWSDDNRYVQSVCGKADLHFWDVHAGQRVRDPFTLRDVVWASYTCTLGWPVRGIYPKMSDGTDITTAHRSPDGRLLVTGDEFRKINLFRYPCGPGSAACRSVVAHARHTGCVRFTSDSKHVISVGGPDLSIVVWRVS